jgi:hypothetical protein
MLAARSNEQPRTWFRSERVFNANGAWFFRTREGVDLGPYESRPEAEIEAGLLRELIRGEGGSALGVIREFVIDAVAMGRPLRPSFDQKR